MRSLALILVFAAFALACIATGELDATSRHLGDFGDGWTQGYGARQRIEAENTQKLTAAGLCTYAALACGGHK